MKRILLIFIILGVVVGCTSKLPKPELSEGLRGELGIDKNINENTIDKYLNRKDSVYYDMRMLIDVADYSKIEGDSYLSGFIKGFEVIPYPLVATVKGLPQEVGEPYKGESLFTINDKNEYIPNYEESLEFLEYFFPKDKYIFLMCGGGGYAGMTKNMLVSLGWDEDKIYNVGGHWFYKGNNNVEVKDKDGNYDFYKVPYHDIDFNNLHKIK